MTAKVSKQALMRRLLASSTAAAGAGEWEVAYHALMAALHAAEAVAREEETIAPIAEIERVAKEQAIRIEKVKPPHQLSRSIAKNRGHSSVYDVLLVHINSSRLRIEANVRRQRSPFRWPNISATASRRD
jgi:hypothetical protein